MVDQAALHTLANYVKQDQEVRSTRCIDERYVLVQARSGKLVVIFLLDVIPSTRILKKAIGDNTRQGIYTLFIMASGLLPGDRVSTQIPTYLHTLHTLYHGKVYAYQTDGARLSVFPVRFQTTPGAGAERQVSYGAALDAYHLTCNHIETSYPIQGFWAIANFQTHAAWEATRFRFERFQARQSHSDYTHRQPSSQAFTPTTRKRYCQVLGISPEAPEEEVRQAYRRLARQNHPDLNTSPGAKERMQEINIAYRELMRHFGDSYS